MAGSAMTFTYDKSYSLVRSVTATWTSDDTTGAVSGTTDPIVGRLIRATTNPGTPAPTTLYDIDLQDADGASLFETARLGNRSATVTETVYLGNNNGSIPTGNFTISDGAITIAITAAGNSKQGTLKLYYEGGDS